MIAAILLLSVWLTLQAKAATTNDFSASTNGWFIDRYAAHSFSWVPVFQGRTNVLQLGIDPAEGSSNRPAPYQSSFYDAQGFTAGALISSNNHWTIYGSLWVPLGVADAAAPFGSELWARTGPLLDETTAEYFMIGLFVGDTNNPSNPNPANPTVAWRVWSDDINGTWTYLPTSVNAGWNDVRIVFDNFIVSYYLNSQLVHTQTSTNMAHPENTTQLSAVLLQAHNFGNVYTSSWSSVGSTDALLPHSQPTLKLQIARSGSPGNNVVLFWSTNSTGFILQQNNNLALSNSWANVEADTVTNNSQIFVTVPMSVSKSFYRLCKP